MIEVIVIRHPDFENDFHVYGGEIKYVDIDLGRADLQDAEEFSMWAHGMEVEHGNLLVPESREMLREIVSELAKDLDHPVPGWAS